MAKIKRPRRPPLARGGVDATLSRNALSSCSRFWTDFAVARSVGFFTLLVPDHKSHAVPYVGFIAPHAKGTDVSIHSLGCLVRSLILLPVSRIVDVKPADGAG